MLIRRIFHSSKSAEPPTCTVNNTRSGDGDDGRVLQQQNSCWATRLPTDILIRHILWRVFDENRPSADDAAESRSSKCNRRGLVACACVCRSWREAALELGTSLQASGRNIIFPSSLKQPGPMDRMVQCIVKRERSLRRSTQTYRLYLSSSIKLQEDAEFLLAAQRFGRNHYIISLNKAIDVSADHSVVGELHRSKKVVRRSSKAYILYAMEPPRCTNKELTEARKQKSVAWIEYQKSVRDVEGLSQPRRLRCQIPAWTAGAELSKNPLVLKNKSPTWNAQVMQWRLNMKGRATKPSVKNFQLVDAPPSMASTSKTSAKLPPPPPPAQKQEVFQFGKVGKDLFTLDYCYPLSLFQAFAICLTSFDTA